MKKKLMSLILILAVAASSALGIVIIDRTMNKAEASIAVISDLHIVSESFFTEENHSYYASRDKMEHLSEAILKTVVDNLIADKKIKTVLVSGDITESAHTESHQAAATILKRLTLAGKKVFVINGNHDTPGSAAHIPSKASASTFREIYWDLGYSDAIVRDDMSLSYVADINDKFRLIAIDNDDYYSTDINGYKEEMDKRLIDWTEIQVKQAVADGRTPIAMAHKPLVNHMPAVIGAIVGEDKLGNSLFKDLAETLADSGCNYIFTGHMHGQDIAVYTSKKGNVLIDIETSSTVYLPMAYRYVTIFKNEFAITSKTIDRLNMEYVSNLNTAEDYASIREDFREYARGHLVRGNSSKILGNLSASTLNELYSVPTAVASLIDLFVDDMGHTILQMPLYGQDVLSIEKIVTQNGGEMPQSDYGSFLEIAASFIITINSGDENIAIDAVELQIMKKCLFAFFYFINDRSEELEQLFPSAPVINIDLERLFSQGELEVIESNLIPFIYSAVREMLPSAFRDLNISDLLVIKLFLGSFVDGMSEGLGSEIVSHMGNVEINLDTLIDEIVFGKLFADVLLDDYPGDNNVTFCRKTLKPI